MTIFFQYNLQEAIQGENEILDVESVVLKGAGKK
jgi:hypothetical protein